VPNTSGAAPSTARPRVVILRGHQANPWELRPWEQPAISDRFAVSYLRTRRGWFDTRSLTLDSRSAWTMRDLLPPGAVGDLAVRLPGDRYLGLQAALRGADIVHAQELGYWYSMQAAKLKRRMGFHLVLTVWETIPLLDAYRNIRTRSYRSLTLAQTDLFLAATERARRSLLLEGVPAERVRVCPPGVATDRFAPRRAQDSGAQPPLIMSPGRLVWEKGHQDVLRAIAVLRRGLGSRAPADVRLLIVGSGPEKGRLQAYARELGVQDAVEFRGFIPYDEMPSAYAEAACVVLASLPTWSWEEQFGMVLAEAMAAAVPIVASSSGAIPEVAGDAARYFSPGDWVGLAERLREALSSEAGPDGSEAERYSTGEAAARIAAAYDEVLAGRRSYAVSSHRQS
jgi:glycosyltransferase involved in cell wall biosynthesis